MNITRENIDNVNAVISIEIEKADYEKQVADVLKEYRQKANIPGFRPGKAPKSLIEKRYKTAVVVDEVNKLLSQNLSKYLYDEKLPVLGEPMPNEEKQAAINWEKDENFTFVFDVALAPEVKVELNEELKLKAYKITVSDEMVDKQIEMATSQLGENVPTEEAKEDSTVRGNFVELDEEGNEVEGGISVEGALIAVDRIADEEIKNSFVGCKKDDVVVFNPMKAFNNKAEVSHLLNIKPEEAENLNSQFRFTVTEVLEFKKAEINEELFKKLYGEDTDVKTEEDFRNRIREELEKNVVSSSDYKFGIDTRDTLVEKVPVELPEAFLMRWIKATNKELTEEQINNDFGNFLKDLRWQMIKESIAKENNVEIKDEEATEFAKKMALAQFQQYGIFNMEEEHLNSYAQMMLEKPEEKERIYKKLLEDKVLAIIKEKATIEEEEISLDDFNKMLA